MTTPRYYAAIFQIEQLTNDILGRHEDDPDGALEEASAAFWYFRNRMVKALSKPSVKEHDFQTIGHNAKIRLAFADHNKAPRKVS